MADQRIDGGAEFDGLVHLGQQGLLRPIGLEGVEHVVERIAMAASVEYQQALDAGQIEYLVQLALARVARGDAGGVDEHHFLAAEQAQQVLQCGLVVRQVGDHAQHAAKAAQLLVRADAVGVERDQADAAGAVLARAQGG